MVADRDWSFATRPKWLLSHLFAGSLIVSFIGAMFWQLDRHDQRVDTNAIIESRALAEPLPVAQALQQPLDELDFVAVEADGAFTEPELIRVANRTQNAVAGDWVIGLYETNSGEEILVNRGFIPRDVDAAPAPDGAIAGWLRETRERELFGAEVSDEGERIPRLDVEAIEARFGLDVAPLWLQQAVPASDTYPTVVPLPALDNGPHLSYAAQWAIFATLGALIYGLLLRRIASEAANPDDAPDAPSANNAVE